MQKFGTSQQFIIGEEIAWQDLGGGVKRKIMSYDDQIMLVNVQFEKGSIGALHSHYHSQVTFVASGAFEVTISEQKQILKEGDSFYIPPHAVHGVVCLEAGVLIDVFSPIREDFMIQ